MISKLSKKKILVLMTPGIGLNAWMERGVFEREIKIYKYYLDQKISVTMGTFDKILNFENLPEEIKLIKMPHRFLLFLLPIYLFKTIKKVDLVKTNQGWRCWWYVWVAKMFKTPIVLRCGWLPGRYNEIREGLNIRLKIYRIKEKWAFRNADSVEVSTEDDRQWLIQKYNIAIEKVRLLPNYVDSQLFSPQNISPKPRSVIFIGRIEKVKNPLMLIRACKEANVSLLTLVGHGKLIDDCKSLASELNLEMISIASVPNNQLPNLICQHQVFVLPSDVEGHPKALLEAMSCGIPCVCTDVPGINSFVIHKDNAYLVKRDSSDIASAINLLFSDIELAKKIGLSARRYVLENFTVKKIFQAELDLINELTA